MKEIPKFQETFIPVLETLKLGEPIKGRELSIRVRDNYYADLSDDQLNKKLKSGGNVLLNRINWGKKW